MRGRTLSGRYRVDDLLGRGGMATVWRGRDLHLDRPVAIKLLERTGLSDPTTLDRFGREARTVARLAHPNVVAVHDFGTDGDDPYLIIELVEGRSLAAMLAAGPLSVEQAISIAAQTCDGLAATHTAGVVHRDIKPGNLMITSTGVVKICDFGIARLHDAAAQATLTATATIIGTCEYMAPEQAAGDAIDGRADLYALGCVLYAMLTGAPPFTGENPLQVLGQHLNQPVVPLRVRRPDVPAELDALVGQLLAKKPADRPADASQVRTRLAAISGAAGHPQAAAGQTAAVHRPAAPPRPGAMRGSAAVVSPTRTIPGLVEPEEARRPVTRRGWLRPVAVSVAALAALLLVAAIALLNQGSGTPTGQQSAGTPPASSPQPRPNTPAGPIDAVQAVQQQIEGAQLRHNVARDLGKDLDEIVGEVRDNDLQKAAEKVGELREKLAELRDEGKLGGDAYQSIAASVDQLAGTLPTTAR